MFDKFKRNKYELLQDPITPESQDGLQLQIAHIESMIEVREAAMARSFEQKVAGEKHDGAHNLDMDMYGMKIQSLKNEHAKLSARLERVSRGLGSSARHASTDNGE